MNLMLLTAFFAVLSGASMLPFFCVWDRRTAKIRKRSLFEKSAGQLAMLGVLLDVLLVAALGADVLFGGAFFSFVSASSAQFAAAEPSAADIFLTGSLPFPTLFFYVGTAALALQAIFLLIGRRTRNNVSFFLAGIAGLKSLGCAVMLIWLFLHGAGAARLLDLWNTAPALAGVFALSAVFLGLLWACALALCWYLLRRNSDDFGRDYYSVMVGTRARQAAFLGTMLLIPASALIWLTPEISADKIAALFPFLSDASSSAASSSAEVAGAASAAVWLGVGSFLVPTAVFLWYMLARAQNPLQRKSIVFVAPAALFLGMLCLFGRLWI